MFVLFIIFLVSILVFAFSCLEMYKVFQEEAFSIALHPSGLYLLVGFSDKLRLMNILIDDIRIFKEITIRGCKEVSTVQSNLHSMAFDLINSFLYL